MSFLFGGEVKTPKEQLRDFKRTIEKFATLAELHVSVSYSFFRSCRELERERKQLEGNEKTIVADMKKYAKEGECCAPLLCSSSHSEFYLLCHRPNDSGSHSSQVSHKQPQQRSKILYNGRAVAGLGLATHHYGFDICND